MIALCENNGEPIYKAFTAETPSFLPTEGFGFDWDEFLSLVDEEPSLRLVFIEEVGAKIVSSFENWPKTYLRHRFRLLEERRENEENSGRLLKL